MSKSNALIAFALVLMVILFGFLMITLGEVRENVLEDEEIIVEVADVQQEESEDE